MFEEIVKTDALGREKGIWKRFLYLLWKARLPIIWIAIYVITYKYLIDIGVEVTEYTSRLFAGDADFKTVILPLISGLLINLILSIVTGIISYLCTAIIDRNLRRMVWKKLVYLPMSYFDKFLPREMISRVTTDTSTVSNLIMKVFIMEITSFYSMYATLARISQYNGDLLYSLLAVIPFVLAIAFIMGKIDFRTNDKVIKQVSTLTQTIAERVTNVPLIKAFANEKKEEVYGNEVIDKLYHFKIVRGFFSSLKSPLLVFVTVLQTVLIVVVGRKYYSDGSIDLAQWIAYLAFAQSLTNFLTSKTGTWGSIKSSQGSLNRVSRIIIEQIEDVKSGISADDMQGGFKLENVSFAYGDKVVIDNISLTIPEGKVTAFIGDSGGGKTTLLNLLERLYKPVSGSIYVGDIDVEEYNLKSYRENIAYVTQETPLMLGTIRENILYGVNREVSEEELIEACKLANAYDFIQQMDNKFEENVGEGGSKLSGGQKQRIAVARALIKKSRYLFLDEATAAMDIKAKDEVWEGIKNLMKGKTVVMVAHDSQTLKNADYIYVINHGKIESQGTHEELAKISPFYRKLLEGGNDNE
ncbi:MAG TPA: ABC transporter ATP-binding protein [Haloplasmataceae bacterium]